MAGLYVHIPFCVSRCVYCAFCSTTKLDMQSRYVDALLTEYALRRDYLKGEEITTVYLGGGTPSVLNSADSTRLLKALGRVAPRMEEFTMECNPDDVTPDMAKRMYSTGVNRVSMGVQTFRAERLRFLRRRHSPDEPRTAVSVLRDAGISNISIDLMYGFPDQTPEEWHADIDEAIRLAPEHISAYCLSFEPGTPLYKMLESGALSEPDEELCRSMYYSLLDRLGEAGYVQYEISNFARQGFRSKHNGGYWCNAHYLGLGAAAHSYDGDSRQWNTSDIEAYISGIESGRPLYEREELSDDEHYNDMIATALRTVDGIDLDGAFKNKAYLLSLAKPLIARGLLEIVGSRLRLTREALFTSDGVLAELIKV